jgi:uncharacterized protein (TIGR02118 family)
MHKLVILIEPPVDPVAFDAGWPEFLHLAEAMPGLRREAHSQVENFLFGAPMYAYVHELFFDSYEDLQTGMASPQGRQAGRRLQSLTGGKMALFFAAHQEDDLSRIRSFTPDDGLG